MSVLSGDEIVRAVLAGEILIDPFDESRVGPNSYDVTLAPQLKTYRSLPLDMKGDNPTSDLLIPPEGLTLEPGTLYLASTVERCGSSRYVPYLDGRSSVGRLGMQIHMTAGRGDLGFMGRWTCEILVAHPLRVYAGVCLGQATFHTVVGGTSRQYSGKYSAIEGATASRLWEDFER